MAVYLLHSSVPLKRSNGYLVQHYMGWAPDGQVLRRLGDHLHGRSTSVLVREFLRLGATMTIGNVWPGETPRDEHRRKRMGHLNRVCYQCRIEALQQEWRTRLQAGGPEN